MLKNGRISPNMLPKSPLLRISTVFVMPLSSPYVATKANVVHVSLSFVMHLFYIFFSYFDFSFVYVFWIFLNQKKGDSIKSYFGIICLLRGVLEGAWEIWDFLFRKSFMYLLYFFYIPVHV